MPIFLNRCRQVWLGWANWPLFRVLVWLICAQWAAVWIEMQLDQRIMHHLRFQKWVGAILTPIDFFDHIIPALMVAAVPMMIVWRLRKDMENWRSAIVPGYRAPHLTVAALIAAALFLLLLVIPTAMDLLREYTEYKQYGYMYSVQSDGASHHPLSLFMLYWLDQYSADYNKLFFGQFFWPAISDFAWILFATIALGWLAAAFSVLAGLAIAIVALAVLQVIGVVAGSTYVWHFWRLNISNSIAYDTNLILSALALDAILIVLLWWRLARIPSGRDSIGADERVPWLSRLLAGVKPPLPGALINAGTWQRARHRRSLGLGRRFVWIVAAFSAAVIAASPLTYRTAQWFQHGDFAFSVLIGAGIVSALAVGLSWPQRFAELSEVELLRPAPRQDCAREIGLAMLIDAVELSLATVLLMFIPIACWSPSMFRMQMFWMAVAAMILSQALTFGVLVWTMLLRSLLASVLAVVISIVALSMLLYYAMDEHWLTPALAAAALGVALTAYAYHRWLRADML